MVPDHATAPAGPLVTVALAVAPRDVVEVEVRLSDGVPATVADAVRTSQLLAQAEPNWVDSLTIAIRGRSVGVDDLLRDGDRIDLCRPLKVDPKMARRERFSQQGARGTGLFSKRRAGAKSGY